MSWWDQAHPPRPSLTEVNLPPQDGKVFMITGGYSGIGYHLAHMLYGKGAKVYIAGRNPSKANTAIFHIRNSYSPSHKGRIIFLYLDLSDLSTIKSAAQTFQRLETRLDVLFNNAGISLPSPSPTDLTHEPHLATNCLGPFLLTKLLLPQLRSTAGTYAAKTSTVRVIWSAAYAVETSPSRGMTKEMLDYPSKFPSRDNFTMSKVGNWFFAAELSRLEKGNGIVSLAVNPGFADTGVWRGWSRLWMKVLGALGGPRKAAYSLLWAGLSDEVGEEDGGRYVVPAGRWHPCPREDLVEAMGTREEGGGIAQAFWIWCDRVTAEFAY